MRKSLMIWSGAAALFAPMTAALAQPSGLYAEAELGAALQGQVHARGSDTLLGPVDLTEPMRRGWMASVAAGRQLGERPLAVEGEALYLNDAVKSDDLNAAIGVSAGLRMQTYGALANLKLEAPTPFALGPLKVSPFVAAGVGYGHAALTILGDHYDGAGALWQAKAGAAFQVTPALSWTLAWRYLHIPTYDTNKLGLAARIESHAQAVSLGLRYSFDAR